MASKTEGAAVKAENKAKADAPKRKMLTPAERVAKLEADLAAAKQRAEAKAGKAEKAVRERIAKLTEKRDLLNEQIATLEAELPQAEAGDSTEAVQDTES